MYKKTIENWQKANLPQTLRDELNSLNDIDLKDAFHKNLDFGTGGLRGVMGVGINRINVFTIKKSTQGFANYLNNNFNNPSVAISYDNRNQSREFAFTAAKVLAANNIKVYITNELRPTPYLSFLTRHFKTSGGIMITASHNPKEYNGYKVYEPHGGQLNLENSEKVIAEINKIDNIFNINEVDNNLIHIIDFDEIDTLYLNQVKKISFKSFAEKATVLYSPLHGAGGTLIPKLLKDLNYNYYSYEPHMINDGNFPNTDSANPEEFIAYKKPIKYAKEINADIIILTDPDADRIGAAVKHEDEYVVINGNQLAVITLNYILENKKNIKNGYVFMSNVTSSLIEQLALSNNLKVGKTLPGFKFIAEEIEKLDKNSTYVFGCEESNGNIIDPFVRDKDAVQATLMFAEIASYVKNKNISMIDYLSQIYEEHGYYLEKTISFEFKGLEGTQKMKDLMTYLRENKIILNNNKLVVFQDILNNKVFDYINNNETNGNLPKQNVLRFEYEDETWIMARPSGTEPKLKVYFSVKDISSDKAERKINALIEYISNLINNF